MRNSALQVFAGGWEQLEHAEFRSSEPIVGATPAAVSWKPDGTKYIIADGTLDTIQEYTVTTPWDETTATPGASFPISGIEVNVRGMSWKLDGTICWIIGTSQDRIFELVCSTPWDISTMTYPGNFFIPTGIGANPTGLYISRDGIDIYITNTLSQVFHFTMLTPNDITTGQNPAVEIINVSGIAGNTQDIFFSSELKNMYLASNGLDIIARFVLSTPGALLTAVFTDSVDTSAEDTTPFGLFIRQTDGKILYVLGVNNGRLYSYDMSLSTNNSLITVKGDVISTNQGESLVVT